MSVKEQIPVNSDIIIKNYVGVIMNANANANSSRSSTDVTIKRIPQVPGMVRKSDDYEKYYVPKVVSIGPYHFKNPNLESVQNHKPLLTRMFFRGEEETITSLFKTLVEPQMVQQLRSFYEEGSTTGFNDMEFTNMMLLDCCFILYYIQYIFARKTADYGGLSKHQIVSVLEDLFLLENQIPFKVLLEGMKLKKNIQWPNKINSFIRESSIVTTWFPKRKWAFKCFRPYNCRFRGIAAPEFKDCDHLLHVLHHNLTPEREALRPHIEFLPRYSCNFRNVSELVDVGIQFEPTDNMSLSSVEFSKGWLRFSANVKLPRIIVNDSTKHMLLNLIAYETLLGSIDDAWVTSYVCLLDSLIDHVEDVKILRRAWVLENFLGSDEEVAKLFNEIGTNLVPNNYAYLRTKHEIQSHYESWSNTLFTQLKTEYFKSPWAFLALLGALIALFLSAIQTYFTIWSPKGECDDLCNSLKNRRL